MCYYVFEVIFLFFDNEGFTSRILSVGNYRWNASKKYVNPRSYSALAMRIAGVSSFDFDDGTHIETKAGDILYVPEKLGYKVDYSTGEIFVFHFHAENAKMNVEKFEGADSVRFAELFSSATRLWREQQNGYRMAVTSIFYEILSQLSVRNAVGTRENPAFCSALSLIEENFRDPNLSFADICRKAGISESAFRRCFVSHFGKTPVNFLTELRLQTAEQMLIGEDKTIEEIAFSCGFSDPKYFCRVVRKYRGCTPTEIRGRYR